MGHINVSTQVNKRIKTGYTATFNYQTGNTVKDITNGSGTGYAAYAYPNNVPLYQIDENFNTVLDADGKPVWNWDNLVSKDYNPIAQTILDPRSHRSSSVFNSVNLNWLIINGLTFDTKVSGRISNYNSDEFRNPFHGDGKAYGGSSDKNHNDSRRFMTTSILTYDKDFLTNHSVNFLVGYETEYYIYKSVNAAGQGYDVPFSDELDLAGKPFGIGSSTLENSMVSYLSRLNYDYPDKYYLSASYRRDDLKLWNSGSLTNSFTYKKSLSFSFQFYWSLGGMIYNSLMQKTMGDGSRYGLQLNKKVLDSWKKPGDVTDVPQFVYRNNTQSNATSSRFLEEGSFLRLRNVRTITAGINISF